MDGGAIQYSRNKDRLKMFSFNRYPSVPILWHYVFVFVCVCVCMHTCVYQLLAVYIAHNLYKPICMSTLASVLQWLLRSIVPVHLISHLPGTSF